MDTLASLSAIFYKGDNYLLFVFRHRVGMLKLLLLLYTDDIVIFFSETADGLENGLDILKAYCNKWKLIVNTNKTKS